MFEKLVAIEPVSLIPSAEEELHRYAKEVALYRDVPASDDEMVRRIGDADAVLLSYTSRMGKKVIAQCPNIRYIGMCCSLYSEESANVDIAYARTRGIKVLGIRDYGDRGVVEYVLHELTGLLHGFGMPMLRDEPVEITGLKVGIVGLGVSGRMIADALQFMGAEISYFARSAKPDAEAVGMTFKPLAQLLAESEVVFTCLNKNVLLLGENEFAQLGAGKVLFNTSIGPLPAMVNGIFSSSVGSASSTTCTGSSATSVVSTKAKAGVEKPTAISRVRIVLGITTPSRLSIFFNRFLRFCFFRSVVYSGQERHIARLNVV